MVTNRFGPCGRTRVHIWPRGASRSVSPSQKIAGSLRGSHRVRHVRPEGLMRGIFDARIEPLGSTRPRSLMGLGGSGFFGANDRKGSSRPEGSSARAHAYAYVRSGLPFNDGANVTCVARHACRRTRGEAGTRFACLCARPGLDRPPTAVPGSDSLRGGFPPRKRPDSMNLGVRMWHPTGSEMGPIKRRFQALRKPRVYAHHALIGDPHEPVE